MIANGRDLSSEVTEESMAHRKRGRRDGNHKGTAEDAA